MRKGKDRRKAWKRRILPGCPPLALGTADVPSLVPASRGRARSAQPGHPQPRQLGYRDAPQAQSPHISPWSGQGGSGRPSAGRGLWLSPSFRPALDPPDRPSPSPTQRGWGRGGGGWWQAGLGVTPPGWSCFLGTPGQQRGLVPAGCLRRAPREGLFSAGAGTRAQGAGLPSMCRFLPCSAGAGSWEPGPPLPFPWKPAPALGNAPGPQFPPQEAGREGGRGDIRLSAPQPRPQARRQGDGRCGGSFWLGKRTRCPAASPCGALLWGATSTLGLTPLSWRGWHPTPALLSACRFPRENSWLCRRATA